MVTINSNLIRLGNNKSWNTHWYNTIKKTKSNKFLLNDLYLRIYMANLLIKHSYLVSNIFLKRIVNKSKLLLIVNLYYLRVRKPFKKIKFRKIKKKKKTKTIKVKVVKRVRVNRKENTAISLNNSKPFVSKAQKLRKSKQSNYQSYKNSFTKRKRYLELYKVLNNLSLSFMDNSSLKSLTYPNDLFFRVSFVTFFSTSYLISNYICWCLSQNYSFSKIRHTIKKKIPKNGKVRGLRFSLSGKINVGSRTLTRTWLYGSLKYNTISTNLDFSHDTYTNKYGSYGVKVWLSLPNK